MGKNYTKYLRRVAAASVCAVVLCLAVMASATYALFHIDVFNPGNTIEVGSFTAEATVTAKTVDETETSATFACGQVCPEGEYELNIKWAGNVDGHIVVTVVPEANTAAAVTLAAEEESSGEGTSVAAGETYIFNLPLSSSAAFLNGEELYSDDLLIPLTVHEPAAVNVSYSWGIYTPAEGESVTVITLDNLAEFLNKGGIATGTAFESSVTLQPVETEAEEPADGETAEETKPEAELIGEKPEDAKIYGEAEYILTVNWTSKFDAYCVLDIVAADEKSGIESQKFIIKLPADPNDEDGVSQLTFPVRICDKAKLTATVAKGSTDNSREWIAGAGVVFGTCFEAKVTVDLIPVASDAQLTVLDPKKTYAAGDYQLKLDWRTATADGYCVITAGEDVWYLTGSVAENAARDRTFMLKLLKDAEISVEFHKGALPEGAVALTAETETLISGAEFKAEASIGAVPAGGETVYTTLTAATNPAGLYHLKLTWSAATGDGYCILFVGDERYYVSCPMAADPAERVITLELMKDTPVTFLTVPGTIPAECKPLTADRIVYGAVFEGTAAIAAVSADGEPSYLPVGEELYAAGEYRLALDWKTSNVDGCILITVTVPGAGENETATVIRYWMSGTVAEKTRVLDLTLTADAAVQVDFVEGSFSGDANAVPADGKITVPVSAAQPAAEEQE